MKEYQPDWDLNLKEGKQAEDWVREVLTNVSTVEVKAPKKFLQYHRYNFGPYVEYLARGLDGEWRPSGIATSKATHWVFKFGSLPGGMLIETEWLRRAARLAFKNPALLREETDGECPTKGVIVTMQCLWDTREGEGNSGAADLR